MIISAQLYAPAGYPCFYIPPGEDINPYLDTWKAVKAVEIGSLPDTTINYTEGAYGPGQIRQAKLKDYNTATGDSLTLRDCLAEPVARRVFMWHMMQI